MKFITTIFFGALPVVASAQTPPSGPIGDTLVQIMAVVQQLVPLMMALAVLVFFWGIVKFIANVTDDEARKGGVRMMIWGMIALFVMVSFWGIIGFVQESFGITGTVTSSSAPILGNPIPTT